MGIIPSSLLTAPSTLAPHEQIQEQVNQHDGSALKKLTCSGMRLGRFILLSRISAKFQLLF